MLRPLHVRRIQQRPLGARRQLAEARGEKGAQGHGARVFAAAFASARIFVAAGGALGRQPSFIAVGVYSRLLGSYHAVGSYWQGLPQPKFAPRYRRRSRRGHTTSERLSFDLLGPSGTYWSLSRAFA